MRPPTSPPSRHHRLDGAQRARRQALGVSFLISAPRGRARSSSCSGPRARGAPPPGRPVRPPPSPRRPRVRFARTIRPLSLSPGAAAVLRAPPSGRVFGLCPSVKRRLSLVCLWALARPAAYSCWAEPPALALAPVASARSMAAPAPADPGAFPPLGAPAPKTPGPAHARPPVRHVSRLIPGVLPSPRRAIRRSTRSCPPARRGITVPCRSAHRCAQPRIGLPRSKAGKPSLCCATSTAYLRFRVPANKHDAGGWVLASPTRVKPSDATQEELIHGGRRNLPLPGITPRKCKAHTASGLNWTGLAWGVCA